MPWSIPAHPHRVFERNPLVAVVAELRFQPILQVPHRMADFQDRVRAIFPGFDEVTRQLVTMGPVAPVHLRQEKLFHFQKADASATLTLTTETLSIESRRHEHRDDFIAEAKLAIDALMLVHGPVAPLRLGLRYVDVLDKDQIAGDLGRETSWAALVTEPFLRVPTGLADLEGTLFASEVASSVASGGGMTVRHGLVQDIDTRTKFRLDVDRYIEKGIELMDVARLLGTFAEDIFAVFASCMGPDLEAWMPERSA